RGSRRREPAPSLRAHARLLGDALRRELGCDPRARPGALRRAAAAHLAHLPVVVRRDVSLAHVAHASLPGDGEQGQRDPLPDEPRVPVPACCVSAAGPDAYGRKTERLVAAIAAAPSHDGAIGLAKRTSNIFRDRARRRPRIDLSHFDAVVAVDRERGLVEAEGMTTFVDLVDATLAHGMMPAVVPQLKSITLGGAVAGVGIEATSFRHGLVHDTIVAIDILTGDGRIVTCTPDNEHRDLFHGFPNSYGTLGYALKLTARTLPVERHVRVDHTRHDNADRFFADLADACTDDQVAFVDGVAFDRGELVLSRARFVDIAPLTSDYTYERIYYRSLREKAVDYLTTRDYL